MTNSAAPTPDQNEPGKEGNQHSPAEKELREALRAVRYGAIRGVASKGVQMIIDHLTQHD